MAASSAAALIAGLVLGADGVGAAWALAAATAPPTAVRPVTPAERDVAFDRRGGCW
ncbi:hypothetical protein AB0L10_15220 [Streptomyces flaveolus]|uniref:hypothetical protein n=1 Tax=Streptomyces flaveolus TaxID=67297 RepID=UPI00343842C1